ncbi:MAG: hypothetical protein GY786_07845 [Proteobacteria bacterium]|nr:hypothetical protein [Pseudomonadota bacterium]
MKSGISDFVHFSDQEIALFSNFPAPDIIVTSETIRHEQFDCSERVYIPHYSVPKLKAVIPKHITFNHLFLAVRPPFCYNELLNNKPISATIHEVGYPKMHARPESEVKLFESNNPVVIFAPSVETEIVLHALEKGILKTFKRMTDLNFIIKLHPTLSAGMFDLSQYIQKQIDGFGNIILDARNSIQSISMDSSLLINDFGSAGAEYRLSFGKRLIYIDVPDSLNGGADLRFRDAFADGRSNIYDLEEVIRSVLAMGDLKKEEWQDMCERTLFSYGFADRTAAQVLNGILPGS